MPLHREKTPLMLRGSWQCQVENREWAVHKKEPKMKNIFVPDEQYPSESLKGIMKFVSLNFLQVSDFYVFFEFEVKRIYG